MQEAYPSLGTKHYLGNGPSNGLYVGSKLRKTKDENSSKNDNNNDNKRTMHELCA